MAKQSKDRDRRAVIEQMRKQQQASERRRTLLVLLAAVVVGAIIIGAAAWSLVRSNREAASPLASVGVSASAAGCQDVVTKTAEGSGQHVPRGTPIEYDDAPPAFGRHWGEFLTPNQIRHFYTADDRPPVEQLVHSLEHGYTILWYDETIAGNDEAVEQLEDIAAKFDGFEGEDKFVAAPWTSEDGAAFPDGAHVALTHWYADTSGGGAADQQGVWQYCEQVSGEALDDFMQEYPFSDSPEPFGA